MKVGLVGRGHVGRAVERLIAPHHDLVSWDVADGGDLPMNQFRDCAMAVVAVGTPSDDDGRLDIGTVREAIEALPNERILLKSTVPPGTTDTLCSKLGREICYWPEYVGQSTYHNPFFPSEIAEVPFVILGGTASATTWALRLLQPMLGPTITYYRCSAVEAEMVKLTENAYFAAKVTFVNEIQRICEAVGADWDTVREGWLLDPRVERMHTLVFPDDPGFDGACLPKDVLGLVLAARDAGYGPAFLEQVLASNDHFRRPAP
jgi:nucleotide sugar dehydrogenase